MVAIGLIRVLLLVVLLEVCALPFAFLSQPVLTLSLFLGIGGIIVLAFLIFLCLRKRRRDEFDGNFDPAQFTSGKGGGGGGTLPKIDLGEDGLIGHNGVGVEEDDGMGGRLGAGPGAGGIITPYSFQPAPVGGIVVGGQQYQNQPQQMSNIGGAVDGATVSSAGYPNEKRAMRQQQQQQQNAVQHTPNTSISSGSLYPSSSHHANQQFQNRVSPEPYSIASDGSSSVGGGGGGSGSAGGIYYQTMGRGPSPGPSVLSSSSGGGRNAKEMEALGRVIHNPDEGRAYQQSQQQQQLPAFQQSYLQSGPGPHQHHQQQLSSSSSATTAYPQSQSPTPSRAGTAVVVHEDGGRVVMRKGEEVEGEGEVLNPEIPPTYDSLPVGVRREA